MANHFDRILKENFYEPGVALLNRLFGLRVIKTLPLPPKMQQTIPENEADSLMRAITADGREFILHIEWQTSNDPEMPARMLFYNAFAYRRYQLKVQSFLVFIGKARLSMPDSVKYGRLQFGYPIIDMRQLNPDLFLQSEVPEEIILAILSDMGGAGNERIIIRHILYKLQSILKDDHHSLSIKLTQLEMLAKLRNAQQLVMEEEKNMPIVYDLETDLRYLQGVEAGKATGEAKVMNERKLLIENLIVKLGLSDEQVADIANATPELVKEVRNKLAH